MDELKEGKSVYTIHLHATAENQRDLGAALRNLSDVAASMTVYGLQYVNISTTKLDMDAPDEEDHEMERWNLVRAINELATEWEDSTVQYKQKMAAELRSRTGVSR